MQLQHSIFSLGVYISFPGKGIYVIVVFGAPKGLLSYLNHTNVAPLTHILDGLNNLSCVMLALPYWGCKSRFIILPIKYLRRIA